MQDTIILPFKNDQLYLSFDGDGYGNATILELNTTNLAAIATIAAGGRYSRDWETNGGYALTPRQGSTMTFQSIYGSELNRQYVLGVERAQAKAAPKTEPVVEKEDQPF